MPSLTSQTSNSRVFPICSKILRHNLRLKKTFVRQTPRKCNEYQTPMGTTSSRCLLQVLLFGGGFRISESAISSCKVEGSNCRHTASGSLKMYQLHSSSLVLHCPRSVPNRASICIQATRLSSKLSSRSCVPNQQDFHDKTTNYPIQGNLSQHTIVYCLLHPRWIVP
jgi:hypothetical protein